MIEKTHNTSNNMSHLFEFEKKPSTFFGKISKKMSKFASPLLFMGGFVTSYTLYNYANFFHLTNIFLLLKNILVCGIVGFSLLFLIQSIRTLFPSLINDTDNEHLNKQFFKCASISLLLSFIGLCLVL